MTPIEQCLERRGDDVAAQFEPNEHGIWCPACGNMIVAAHLMNEDDLELPEDCDECGYPDEEEMAEYFLTEEEIDGLRDGGDSL